MLMKGSSKEAMGMNYKTERRAGKPKKMALAIMLKVAKGKPEKKKTKIKASALKKMAQDY